MNLTAHTRKPYIEEIEDEDSSPAVHSLPYELDGPIVIQILPDNMSSNHNTYDGSAGLGQSDEDRQSEKSSSESEQDNGENDEGSNGEDEGPQCDRSWEARQPPSFEAAQSALADINRMLKPPRISGKGHKECQLPLQLRTRLKWIASFLHIYTDTKSVYGNRSHGSRWMASSLLCTHTQQGTTTWAKNLRKWARALIQDQSALPVSNNGTPRNSRIDDEDVAADIALHLQSLGPYI